MCAYAYLVRCSDGSLYAGWTNDLEKRLKAHNQGCGAKYTRGRRPVSLAYCEAYQDRKAAQTREYELKRLSKTEKEVLVESYREKE